jgi:hypothetical protein
MFCVLHDRIRLQKPLEYRRDLEHHSLLRLHWRQSISLLFLISNWSSPMRWAIIEVSQSSEAFWKDNVVPTEFAPFCSPLQSAWVIFRGASECSPTRETLLRYGCASQVRDNAALWLLPIRRFLADRGDSQLAHLHSAALKKSSGRVISSKLLREGPIIVQCSVLAFLGSGWAAPAELLLGRKLIFADAAILLQLSLAEFPSASIAIDESTHWRQACGVSDRDSSWWWVQLWVWLSVLISKKCQDQLRQKY